MMGPKEETGLRPVKGSPDPSASVNSDSVKAPPPPPPPTHTPFFLGHLRGMRKVPGPGIKPAPQQSLQSPQ